MSSLLFIPGLGSSGPSHWQTWWQALEPKYSRVEQENWNESNIEIWSSSVGQALDRITQPAWVIAHSYGCLATILAARTRKDPIHGALLVAPPDPERLGLADHVFSDELRFPTLVVASSNDNRMEIHRAELWSRRWGSRFVNLGPCGHINTESGFGPWLQGVRLFESLRSDGMKSWATDRC